MKDPADCSLSAILLGTVTRGLESSDRFIVLRCMETLCRLAQRSDNETLLMSSLDAHVSTQNLLQLFNTKCPCVIKRPCEFTIFMNKIFFQLGVRTIMLLPYDTGCSFIDLHTRVCLCSIVAWSSNMQRFFKLPRCNGCLDLLIDHRGKSSLRS